MQSSQDGSQMDIMSLLHNTIAAIGTRFDRTIATSHAKLLQRMAEQDTIILKQQEMVQAMSEKISNLQPPSSPNSRPSPHVPTANIDSFRNLYMEMRHFRDIVGEGFKSLESSTRTGFEELRDAINTRFNTIEGQLKDLRSKNVHVRDSLLSRHPLHYQPSTSPATVITQRWQNPANSTLDLQDEYEHHDYDETLVCVNPLDTVKNQRPPPRTDYSTPYESSTQLNSTRSLPARNESTSVAAISLGTSPELITARSSYNPADSPLTTISELEDHQDHRYRNGAANASSSSTSSPKKRKRRLHVVVPTDAIVQPSSSKPRKQRRLDAEEDTPQSSRTARTSTGLNKKKRPLSSGSKNTDDIWPKQGKSTNTSHQFIQCDRCQHWFHWGCVGIDVMNARRMSGTEFMCPPCTVNNVEWKSNLITKSTAGREHCSRPHCPRQDLALEEFFIEKFVGRFDRDINGPTRYAWLIKWEGYSIDQCDWTPENELEAPDDFIERFEKEAKSENAFAKGGPLILLKEAIKAGWDTRVQ